MAAAPPLPKQRRWVFIYPFPWRQTGLAGHSRAPYHQKGKRGKNKKVTRTSGRVWGAARSRLHPTPLPSDPPRDPYSSMASFEAGSYSPSTSTPPLGVSRASVGGSSGGEVLPRCLHVGEGDLRPFASPRAALFVGQAFACTKWGPLQFAHLATVC